MKLQVVVILNFTINIQFYARKGCPSLVRFFSLSLRNFVLKSDYSANLSNIIMKQEVRDSLRTFKSVTVDSQLLKIIVSSDRNHNRDMAPASDEQPCYQNTLDHFSISEEEIQKRYTSEETPGKKFKNKKIKKTKLFTSPILNSRGYNPNLEYYIDILYSRVKELQVQVQKLKTVNKLNIQYIRKLTAHSEININDIFVQRRRIGQRLQKLINENEQDQTKIDLYCSSLLRKQASYGSERIKAIQYYAKQLINMTMTDCHKYLAETALKNLELFNPASIDNWQQQRKELFRKLNLGPHILSTFAQNRQQILNLHKKFNQKCLEMYRNKCSLLQLSHQIEGLYKNVNEKLTPMQKGRLFCFIQKYNFNNNFDLQEATREMVSEHTNLSSTLNQFQKIET